MLLTCGMFEGLLSADEGAALPAPPESMAPIEKEAMYIGQNPFSKGMVFANMSGFCASIRNQLFSAGDFNFSFFGIFVAGAPWQDLGISKVRGGFLGLSLDWHPWANPKHELGLTLAIMGSATDPATNGGERVRTFGFYPSSVYYRHDYGATRLEVGLVIPLSWTLQYYAPLPDQASQDVGPGAGVKPGPDAMAKSAMAIAGLPSVEQIPFILYLSGVW